MHSHPSGAREEVRRTPVVHGLLADVPAGARGMDDLAVADVDRDVVDRGRAARRAPEDQVAGSQLGGGDLRRLGVLRDGVVRECDAALRPGRRRQPAAVPRVGAGGAVAVRLADLRGGERDRGRCSAAGRRGGGRDRRRGDRGGGDRRRGRRGRRGDRRRRESGGRRGSASGSASGSWSDSTSASASAFSSARACSWGSGSPAAGPAAGRAPTLPPRPRPPPAPLPRPPPGPARRQPQPRPRPARARSGASPRVGR